MKQLNILQELLVGAFGIKPERIWAENNDIDIPNDKGIYIVLSPELVNPVANNIRYKTADDGTLKSYQYIVTSLEVTVHLVSRDMSARNNLNKLLFAFGSDITQRISEQNACNISRISDVIDASAVEGAGMLNRFDVRVKVITGEEINMDVPYYDQFGQPELLIET